MQNSPEKKYISANINEYLHHRPGKFCDPDFLRHCTKPTDSLTQTLAAFPRYKTRPFNYVNPVPRPKLGIRYSDSAPMFPEGMNTLSRLPYVSSYVPRSRRLANIGRAASLSSLSSLSDICSNNSKSGGSNAGSRCSTPETPSAGVLQGQFSSTFGSWGKSMCGCGRCPRGH